MRAKEFRQGVMIAGLLLVALWLGSLIWSLGEKARVAITEADNTKAQFQNLEARKDKLESDITAFNTPRGQDAAIREAFGVAKSGEEVIVVVPPAEASSSPPESWWQKVLDWF